MSMEINVFFRGGLPSTAALGRVMKELGFPLTIPAGGSLDGHEGFLPMRLNGEDSGVEFDVFDDRADIDAIANGREVDPKFERSANFRWGGDEDEMLCALCGSAALAQLTQGVVLGDDDDLPLSAEQAIAVARRSLESVLKRKPQDNRGTRPADIKRYLKPLLAQRSDLVLFGRLLVIRPVRHLLRGAFLDRTDDKYEFRSWRYVDALYDPLGGVGYGDDCGLWISPVWQPHFEPLLMDVLAEDVFSDVGPITTLNEFADMLAVSRRTPQFDAVRVRSLVLAGERDRAADYVRKIEHHDPSDTYWESWAKEQWEFLARDIAAVCAEFHAKEAETVKAMKLEAIWEPSPFPVELPVAERTRSAEPYFPPAPWISTPSWLLQEPPDRAGEVFFAKSSLYRAGRPLMEIPLSRDDAEDRHRNGEPYVLAARLPDGRLVVVRRDGTDRNDPRYSGARRGSCRHFDISLYGSVDRINASFRQDDPPDGVLRLWSIDVVDLRAMRLTWHCFIFFDPGEASIDDRRDPDNGVRTTRKFTAADREMSTGPAPGFGEFDGPLARALAWLRHAGYGGIP